jgi:hypothetical protein
VAVSIKICCKSAGTVETITENNVNVTYCTQKKIEYHANSKYLWGKALVRRLLRYQRGNQNLYIEEEQTTQWPKEKVQKDKQ